VVPGKAAEGLQCGMLVVQTSFSTMAVICCLNVAAEVLGCLKVGDFLSSGFLS
jgi:hypothetical protein